MDKIGYNKRVQRYSHTAILSLFIILLISIFWNVYLYSEHARRIALANAIVFVDNDATFMSWATTHGGLYSPTDEKTKANPLLSFVPKNKISLPDGDSLILMNPAYMLRQFHKGFTDSLNIKIKITSLDPFNKDNTPDAWEKRALFRFEKGENLVSEFISKNGIEELRLIKPLIIEKKCLKCHGVQGYKVGDIRGGVSIKIPMKSTLDLATMLSYKIIYVHIFIFFLGFVSIKILSIRFIKKHNEYEKARSEISSYDKRLKLALQSINAGVWDWNMKTREATFNERWAEISGYTLKELEPTDIETWNRLVHPEDLPKLDKKLEEHFAHKTEYYNFETRMIHKSGKIIWVLISGKVIEWNEKNEAVRMVGIITDITKNKESEEVLKRANEQFSTVMNSLDSSVYVADIETYELLFVNEKLKKEKGDIIGKTCWKVLQENQTGPCEFCTNNKIISPDGTFGNIYRWEFQNTSDKKWYLLSDRAIRWYDGRIARIEIATDITERKESELTLKETEERFRTTFENAIDPIIIAKINGENIPTVYDINSTALKTFGYSYEEIVGQPVIKIHDEENPENIINRVKKILNGEKLCFESTQKLKGGETVPVEMSAKLIKINNESFIYIVERDISDRKKWENDILAIQKQLKEELANKDRFFSIISHDLKSPFGALLGVAQLLEEDYDMLDNPERKELIRVARNSAVGIFELLESLLEWARANLGKMEYSPVMLNISKIANTVTHVLAKNAEDKEIELINMIHENILLYADENMIRTILRNLIANAIKFTNRGGKIEISLVDKESFVEIWVADNGVGIPDEIAKNLFRLDKKVTTVGTEDETGTGVGLLLCKELIEKHNGNIWAESKVGKGSTFKFLIPKREI